ncbi:carbohydrate sulfotransferase 9-like [Pelodytes ibericus]
MSLYLQSNNKLYYISPAHHIIFVFLVDYPTNLDTQKHRKDTVKLVCQQHNLTGNASYKIPRLVSKLLFVEHNYKFIYCEVPKVGCTNWKRIILLLNQSLSPTDLKHDDVHGHPSLLRLSSYPPTKQKELLQSYTKVMFVRDPLQRFVSAYRDKFLHKQEVYYYKTFAGYIKRKFRNDENSTEQVTFEEFSRYVIEKNPPYRDTHWMPMYQLCDPCNIQYDIVGKLETMTKDSDLVLKTIRAPENITYPSIKHYAGESRTNEKISMEYFRSLPTQLLKDLMEVYEVDFSMFEYTPASILPKLRVD